jgi:Gpi18-like mannosyltransferase
MKYFVLFVAIHTNIHTFLSVLSPIGAWDLTDKYAELVLEIQRKLARKNTKQMATIFYSQAR